jgi:hypothetical protein
LTGGLGLSFGWPGILERHDVGAVHDGDPGVNFMSQFRP